MEQNQGFLREISQTSPILYIATLIKKMKSIALEKREFKNRDESISQTILAFAVHAFSKAERN